MILIMGDCLSVLPLELEGKMFRLSAIIFECFCQRGIGVSIFFPVYVYVFQNQMDTQTNGIWKKMN